MDASKGRLEYWIEKERLLPDTDFCFSEPKCMAAEDVILLASWIIKGELGLLEENKRFRWVGQADISLPPNVPHGSAKRKNTENRPAPVQRDAEDASHDATEKSKKTGSNGKATSPNMTSGVSKASSVTEEVLQKPPNKTRMTAAKRKIESSLDVSKPSPIAKKHKKLRASDQEREQVRGSECFDLDISSSSDTDLDMERTIAAVRHMKRPANSSNAAAEHLLFRGERGAMSRSQYAQWNLNFSTCEANLDWEDDVDGVMGASAVNLLRFIEGSEYSGMLTFSMVLDVTLMPTNFSHPMTTLFEEICNPDHPLPIPRMVGHLNEWSRFLDFIRNRVQAALFALMTHPTDSKMSQLYIGRDLGLMPTLRMLEFVRRCFKTDLIRTSLDEVEALVRHAETVLGKEMWRRWASSSFVRVRHTLGGKLCGYWHIYIEAVLYSGPSSPEEWFRRSWSQPHNIGIVEANYEQACLRNRSHGQDTIVVNCDMNTWSRIEVIQAMHSWARDMTPTRFAAGGLIDKFVWMYTLYMTAGHANVGTKAWINKAIHETGLWLHTAIIDLYPELWEMRAHLVRSSSEREAAAVSNNADLAESEFEHIFAMVQRFCYIAPDRMY